LRFTPICAYTGKRGLFSFTVLTGLLIPQNLVWFKYSEVKYCNATKNRATAKMKAN